MARVSAFKGIRYNPQYIDNPSDVMTPPYDVISPDEQRAYYDRHPKSIIRLILGKNEPDDTPAKNRHTRAAAYFKQWRAEGVLLQESDPALYLTSVEIDLNGEVWTRYGLIALVELEPFEKGIVLPHEKTFSKVKSERLELMKVCHANFSPIFSIFSDPAHQILATLKNAIDPARPDQEVVDRDGLTHRLFRITAPQVHRRITELMADKIIYIADGHHRYETALNYRDWVAERAPGFDGNHPANRIMMYLSSMEDPGLIILPAHRLLKAIDRATIDDLPQRLAAHFDVRTFSDSGRSREDRQGPFLAALAAGRQDNAIGMVSRSGEGFYLLTPRPGRMMERYGRFLSPLLCELDVSVMTHLIFMETLGFDQERLNDETTIAYTSNAPAAIDRVFNGECDLGFILNPTRIAQVRNIASAGLSMPRKSTYFYPKVITGLVLNPLD